AIGWLQIIVFLVIILALVKPLGIYMYRVYEGDRQPLPRVLGRVERGLNWLTGVDAKKEQDWKAYALSVLAFSLFGLLVTYILQRIKQALQLNPRKLAADEPLCAVI